MEKTKRLFLAVLKRAFSIHSIGTKIAITCFIDSLVLVLVLAFVFSNLLYKQELGLVDESLHSDLNMLERFIEYDGGAGWRIEDGTLYCGTLKIGDGTEENANTKPFLLMENLSKTDCYCMVRYQGSDSDLKWFGDKENGYMEGHYVRAAGSTKGTKNESIIGTKLDAKIAAYIDRKEEYSGEANVAGRIIYSLYKPLCDKDGNVVGIISAGQAVDTLHQKADTVRNSVIGLLVAICIAAGLVILLITAKWASNIAKVEQYLDRIIEGELPEDKLSIHSGDEIMYVADSINEMVDSLRDKERIGVELNLATDIQASMLPSIFPAFPDFPEFDLFATMHPAKEVGGDFYDFFMLDNKRIVITIADVSGKGVPAALFMVITKTLIKNYTQMGLQPADIFTTVNKILCESNQIEMFVTAWLAIINVETGEMTYVNAGHNSPVVCHKGGNFELLHQKPGFVLAGMEGMRYKQSTIMLDPGDKILLYTDGITEATDRHNAQYGTDRLLTYLNENKDNGPRIMLEGVKENIDDFVGAAEQFDDMTMLMFELKKKMSPTDEHDKFFSASDEALAEATAFVEEELEKAGVGPKVIMQIALTLEEVFVNIAHYAYPNMDGTVCIGVTDLGEEVQIRFTDSGIPFDPLKKTDPDVTATAEERGIGGLGIFLVKQIMDDVQYDYVDNKNVLTLRKKKEG